MATTTTNFGWDIPQSTDLVKDGATAIAGLGQDIDTALVDLKGGTTGQVLSKASNTDLDYSWVAVDPLLILDAKGDLITATAADTPARLPVGANGTVLTADSTQGTGLRWATPSGGGKLLQVVSATTATTVSINTTTNTDTGITATITPTLSTSKILVMISSSLYIARNSSGMNIGGRILRGGTTILDQGAFYILTMDTGVVNNLAAGSNVSLTYLDSPATTSATTYKLQARHGFGGAIDCQPGGSNSTITLFEIGA
jgi:hypothetical protein